LSYTEFRNIKRIKLLLEHREPSSRVEGSPLLLLHLRILHMLQHILKSSLVL
jgi:hypothetical protein